MRGLVKSRHGVILTHNVLSLFFCPTNKLKIVLTKYDAVWLKGRGLPFSNRWGYGRRSAAMVEIVCFCYCRSFVAFLWRYGWREEGPHIYHDFYRKMNQIYLHATMILQSFRLLFHSIFLCVCLSWSNFGSWYCHCYGWSTMVFLENTFLS